MEAPNREYYNNLSKQCEDGEITEEEYMETLDKDNCIASYYMKSCFYLGKGKFQEAKKEIDEAISIANSLLETKILTGSIQDLKNVRFLNPKFQYFNAAGEIYANLGNTEESLKFYIKSQYFAMQLKSDFDGINSGYVYSFRSVSTYSLSDLISNSITVCHPSKMNDPFDSLFLLWADEKNLNKICTKKAHIKPFRDSFQYFKIRCFVGNEELTSDDNIVKQKIAMWSHYADEHRGYCIKYKLSEHFIKENRNTDYSHKYLKKVIPQPADKIQSVNIGTMNTNELFAFKSHEWENENEIRLISYDASCKDDFQQIPLDESSRIETIYFGYRCPQNSIRDIMKILGNHVEYYKMDCDYDNIYSLKMIEINTPKSYSSEE